MSDTKSGDDKTLSVTPKKTLTLKRPGLEQSTVRQNFSHGRTNNVVVETKKRRIVRPDDPKEAPVAPLSSDRAAALAASLQAAAKPAAPPAALRPEAPKAEAPKIEAAAAAAAAAASSAAAPASEPVTVADPAPAAIAAEPAPAPAAETEAPAPEALAANGAEAGSAAAPAPVEAPPAKIEPPRAFAPSARPASGGYQGSPRGPSSGGTPGRTGSAPLQGTARPGQTAQPPRPGTPGVPARPAPAAAAGAPAARQPRGAVLNDLSSREMDARRRALELAKQREAEDRRLFLMEEARRIADDDRRRVEREESERRQAEEAARLEAEASARRKAEEDASRRPSNIAQPPVTNVPGEDPQVRPARGEVVKGTRRADGEMEEVTTRSRGGPAGARRPVKVEVAKPARVHTEEDRRKGKLTLDKALTAEEGARVRSLSSMRRRQEKFKRSQMNQQREKIAREVTIPETITIQELANRMSERAVDVIKFLMAQGQMMKPGDVIEADLAEIIAGEFGHTVKRVAASDIEEGIFNVADNVESMVARPPVVTIMGHVDHGKTSLLDAIRKTNVVSGEAGGITQHIGAYQVEHGGHTISFIDTPGHAAFTAMRARGAQATDIAILVVAADDSVMPQTIESISHAKAAGVPIIVAINKVDKPAADPQKVRTQLLQHEVFVESMGGEVLDVEVSAKTGAGLDKLLEAVQLQAELLELRADPNRTAEGVVIEAELDKGRGPVATVLVQSGTLKTGDIVVAGDVWGKVRAIVNDKGGQLKQAAPSMPVEVLGMQGTPQAGDRFAVVADEARAREIAEYRQRLTRDKQVAKSAGQRGSLEQMMSQLQDTGLKEFPLLIKGDVQGSVEAILGALDRLGTDEVRARIVHSGAGAITESDITLASASTAAIIGFNVRANAQARQASEREGIEIRYYNIIYDLVDDVKAAMSGLLSPERRETFIGNAQILEVFDITKTGKVAGCRITEGKVERGAGVRLIRDGIVIHEGTLKTLKRFKDEVSEVPGGQECGMAFEKYEDMRVGDVIECFRVEHVARSL